MYVCMYRYVWYTVFIVGMPTSLVKQVHKKYTKNTCMGLCVCVCVCAYVIRRVSANECQYVICMRV